MFYKIKKYVRKNRVAVRAAAAVLAALLVGLRMKGETTDELADGLLRLALSADERLSFGRRARQRVARRHGAEVPRKEPPGGVVPALGHD